MTEQKKKQLPVWQESILLVATAMVMAVIVKTFFLQAFYIPSESMEPTMLVNDKILVQKVSYWGGDVKRGDIVVFDDPGGWLNAEDSKHASNPIQKALETVGLFPTGGHLIKRVIGVGGDTIACCTDGKLTINGKQITEPYVLDETATKDKTFKRQGAQGPPVGHGRQPRQLQRLARPPGRSGRRLHLRGQRRRQGLAPRMAVGPRRVHPQARHVRRQPRSLIVTPRRRA